MQQPKLDCVPVRLKCNSSSTCRPRRLRLGDSWRDIFAWVVTACSCLGAEQGSWSGRFDLEEHEDRVVFDDADGSKVILCGGVFVAAEAGAFVQPSS